MQDEAENPSVTSAYSAPVRRTHEDALLDRQISRQITPEDLEFVLHADLGNDFVFGETIPGTQLLTEPQDDKLRSTTYQHVDDAVKSKVQTPVEMRQITERLAGMTAQNEEIADV